MSFFQFRQLICSLTFAITVVSKKSAASWVVNAFVEATPISGPALVRNFSFAKRMIDDSGTLHIARVFSCPSLLAYSSAAIVSAVSPDWEITIKRQSLLPIGFR